MLRFQCHAHRIIFEDSFRRLERSSLERVVRDRNAAQEACLARIELYSADGVGTAAIMRHTGKSKT